ncbi:MAG: carbon storage regulator CsrA [Bacillota bacterium]
MLVLTRKQEESIIVDDQVEIKILEIEGNQVKLGIEAPSEISIHRQEVYCQIEDENKQAVIKNKGELNQLLKEVQKSSKQSKSESN